MNRAWSRLRPWLVAGGLGALALGTWRSFPTGAAQAKGEPALRVVLFDLSAGTTRLRPGHALWARSQLRTEALEAAQLGEELALGVYARDVRSLGSAAPEEWLARLEGRGAELLQLELGAAGEVGSQLDAALALFELPLCSATRPAARLVIAGEDDYSGEDPRPRLARLAAEGVQVEWRGLPPIARLDFSLEGLRLPHAPAPGSPLALEFDLSLAAPELLRSGPAPGRQLQLQLQIESAGETREERVKLFMPAGHAGRGESLQWSARCDLGSTARGLTRVLARVRIVDGEGHVQRDPMPENDTLSCATRAGQVRLVAALASPAQQPALRRWIGANRKLWPGLEWRVLEPRELPGALAELDLIVSLDLGPSQLPARLVENFVRGGGGWLFCAGWGALAGWFPSQRGPARGSNPARGLNPVLPLYPAPAGGAPRDVLVLVDGSGSMAGEAFERVRRALASLVLCAPPEDALAMHFFTGTLGPALDLGAGTEGPRAALERLFAAHVPGGPTAILYSLEALLEQRAGISREALVILLSDGKEVNGFNVAERARTIHAALSQGSSRLVVIAAGEEPELELLQALAGGEPLRRASVLDDLSEIFQRELFKRRSRTGERTLLLGAGGRMPESADLLSAWSRATSPWPPFKRYLRCEAQEGADVLWLDEASGEPLLAWQRVGRGKVAAWASAPLEAWAPRYPSERGRLGALLRLLARSPSDAPALRLEWRAGHLRLSAVPLSWPAQLDLTFRALVPGLGGIAGPEELELARSELWLGAPRPGVDARRERAGTLPAPVLERALGRPLSVDLRDPRDNRLLGQVGLDLACHPEFLRGSATRLERPLPAPTRTPRSASARDEMPRADPLAWVWLALGLCCLSAAGLMGSLSRPAAGPH